MVMIKFKIDGRTVEAKEGSTILEIARALFVDIPTLCYHPELSSFGACRLCTVDVKRNGEWKLVASCDVPIESGIEVVTNSEKVKEARKLAAELLYRRYPNTKAVADIANRLGVAVKNIDKDANECIVCGLCVRVCREIVGVNALRLNDRGLGRGVEEASVAFDSDACIGCGSCAYVCPTSFVKMEEIGDKRIIWGKAFKVASCSVCGRVFAPVEQLEAISKKTGVSLKELLVCTSCR
jgi:bidirectional [NiFe] hydrogenase diaphorase subunit